MNIRHIGIYVQNIEKSIEFYKDTFAFDILSHEIEKGQFTDELFDEKEMIIEVCKMKTDNDTVLELIEVKSMNFSDKYEGKRIYDLGRMHIAFTVNDAEKMSLLIVQNGGEVISKPLLNANGRAKVFFARDPEGNYLEIVEEV